MLVRYAAMALATSPETRTMSNPIPTVDDLMERLSPRP